ncbi:MAG: hypothetical protein GX055_01640 [Desulfovibrionales bacterium]|nr:hypothetical protein [Desulfovibrionales bacterium]
MPDTQKYFERFCQLGREEQALIAQQDTKRLGEVASEREVVMREFLDSAGQHHDDAFFAKLRQMQALHTSLRSEAQTLYQTLKDELLKLRSENKRLGGYRAGATITPLHSQLMSRSG